MTRQEPTPPARYDDLRALFARYPSLTEIVWAQEEPKNQGAWTYVQPRLRASAGAAFA